MSHFRCSFIFILAASIWVAIPVLSLACTGKSPNYKGPLFDAMAQIDERADWDLAIKDVKRAGVGKIALFARSRKSLGENEEEVLDLAEKHPGLIVLGAPKYFLLEGDLPRYFIEATIKGVCKHRYAFVGEILYTHGDKSHGKQTFDGERYVDPLSPGTTDLLRRLAPLGVPLMTHWEVYAWDRDRPRFGKLYRAHPNQVFIMPHMGFGKADQVRTLLERHPNLYMTMSKKDQERSSYSDPEKRANVGGSIVDECGFLKPEWKAILLKYQSRILFATDAHKDHRWKRYEKLVKSMRRILGQLPDNSAKNIAYRNAERIYKVKLPAR